MKALHQTQSIDQEKKNNIEAANLSTIIKNIIFDCEGNRAKKREEEEL